MARLNFEEEESKFVRKWQVIYVLTLLLLKILKPWGKDPEFVTVLTYHDCQRGHVHRRSNDHTQNTNDGLSFTVAMDTQQVNEQHRNEENNNGRYHEHCIPLHVTKQACQAACFMSFLVLTTSGT